MEYERRTVGVLVFAKGQDEPFEFYDKSSEFYGTMALNAIERGEDIVISAEGSRVYVPFHAIDRAVVTTDIVSIQKPSPYGCELDDGNDNIIYSNPSGYQPTSTQSGIWWYDLSGLKFTPLQVGDKLLATMTNGESYGITVTSATDSSWRAKQDGYTGSASTSMTSSGNLSVAIKIVEGDVLGLTKLEIVE